MTERVIKSRETHGWIGIDLDGTLAEDCQSAEDVRRIRPPIPAMLARVKGWLAEGKDVRIFTARVGCCGESSAIACDDEIFATEQRLLIEDWCLTHLGRILPVTATKDFLCLEIWDDRAVQVVTGTGMTLQEVLDAGLQAIAEHTAADLLGPLTREKDAWKGELIRAKAIAESHGWAVGQESFSDWLRRIPRSC
jgi:hypothetical protein